MSAVLTADLGNSSVKLCAWVAQSNANWSLCSSLRWEYSSPSEALVHWEQSQASGPLWYSSVASAQHTQLCLEALAARRSRVPEHGLLLDLPAPITVGSDRLFACRGAFARRQVPALVIDAGTAVTVDALTVQAGKPHFLGGAIAAGPSLLSQALARGTARLFAVDAQAALVACGKTTAEALRAGLYFGMRGAVRELVEQVGRETGLGAAPVYLCGGARQWIEDPLLYPGHELLVDEHLVHWGLLAAGSTSA